MSARRQGGPPAEGRGPVTLAEHLHLCRRRIIIYTAGVHHGYKHRVCRELRISRPHLDKWIKLYGLRGHFRRYGTGPIPLDSLAAHHHDADS